MYRSHPPSVIAPTSASRHIMVIKNVIFLILTVLPSLLEAQFSDDGGLGNSGPLVPLMVTEIRRIMPIEMQGSWNARNHQTLVRVEGLTTLKGNISFDLFYSDKTGFTNTYYADVILEGDDALNITFNGTLPDVDIEKTALFAFKTRPTLEAFWRGKFIIPDLKARVAVIDNNYVRVTTGDLGSVTDGKITCETDNSPCYFREEDLFTFPPKIKRCITLPDNDAELLYCDETVSESTFLSENPTLLLLDDSNLNLGYSETNTTFEVLTIDPEGNLLSQDKPYSCKPTETRGSGCAMEVNIPVGTELVNFTVVSIDELGYLEGSTSYPFNIFEVNTMQLTEDAVMTNWIPNNKNKFDVFIMSNTNLDDFEFKSNLTCESIVDCEYFFTGVTEKGGYIAVVQMQEVNNAIGKTIKGGASEQSTISKISKTTESGEIVTTFTVEETTTIPSSAKLVEVTISDKMVSNKLFSGSVDVVTGGYTFTCPEDIGSLEIERNLLHLGYCDSIPKAGAAYIKCSEFDVQLDWMASSAILREVVDDERNITIGYETCDKDKSPCYFEASTTQTEFISLCTKIKNASPIRNQINYCEDQKPINPPELSDVEILLDGSQLKVTAALDDPDATLEIKVYDPKNPNDIFSTGDTTCAPKVVEIGVSIQCEQPLQVPNAHRTVKVIVSEIDFKGVVHKSSISNFQFPSAGVQIWVIVVSVLGSISIVAIIAFIAVVAIKQKKARKLQSNAVEKELDTVSQIRLGNLQNSQDDPDNRSPTQARDNNSERELYLQDEEPQSHSRNCDSPMQSYERMSRKSPSPYPKDLNSSNSPGYDNMGYSLSINSEGGPVALPVKVLPKDALAPNNASSSPSLHQNAQL